MSEELVWDVCGASFIKNLNLLRPLGNWCVQCSGRMMYVPVPGTWAWPVWPKVQLAANFFRTFQRIVLCNTAP